MCKSIFLLVIIAITVLVSWSIVLEIKELHCLYQFKEIVCAREKKHCKGVTDYLELMLRRAGFNFFAHIYDYVRDITVMVLRQIIPQRND